MKNIFNVSDEEKNRIKLEDIKSKELEAQKRREAKEAERQEKNRIKKLSKLINEHNIHYHQISSFLVKLPKYIAKKTITKSKY